MDSEFMTTSFEVHTINTTSNSGIYVYDARCG